jgi:hypothetical protein
MVCYLLLVFVTRYLLLVICYLLFVIRDEQVSVESPSNK